MKFKKILTFLAFFCIFFAANAAEIMKDLTYKKYTLPDKYTVTIGKKKYPREFRWDLMKEKIQMLDDFYLEHAAFGNLRNYKNSYGLPPLINGSATDDYGVSRQAAIPLYSNDVGNLQLLRYGRDGAFLGVKYKGDKYSLVNIFGMEGDYLVENKYIKFSSQGQFDKLIFVDIKYQHLASIEREGEAWIVRSMNPVTTGLEKPPYSLETPPGVFMLQEKKSRMLYLEEGSQTEIEGYAPYASRFSRGAYLHGFPVVGVDAPEIEYSGSLGTTPRSHMCVRNSTSHAKFLYEWAPVGQTLVITFE